MMVLKVANVDFLKGLPGRWILPVRTVLLLFLTNAARALR